VWRPYWSQRQFMWSRKTCQFLFTFDVKNVRRQVGSGPVYTKDTWYNTITHSFLKRARLFFISLLARQRQNLQVVGVFIFSNLGSPKKRSRSARDAFRSSWTIMITLFSLKTKKKK
jgi:hypothetical protein